MTMVVATFRSRFGARVSNRKANCRANRRSLAAIAVDRVCDFLFGGQKEICSNENHQHEKVRTCDWDLNCKILSEKV